MKKKEKAILYDMKIDQLEKTRKEIIDKLAQLRSSGPSSKQKDNRLTRQMRKKLAVIATFINLKEAHVEQSPK